jgi:HD-GYP domain-containing protein (c-di-GMP phosphodiesterase class II)
MSNIRIRPGEVQVGEALPWPVYDRASNLLLREGYVIHSDQQLTALLERGMYRAADPGSIPDHPAEAEEQVPEDPFLLFDELGMRLEKAFQHLAAARPDAPARVLGVVDGIRTLCARSPDAALGAVHLCHHLRYTTYHPLHVAILCEMVGRNVDWPDDTRRSLVAAALTQNCAMIELQEALQNQKEPLSAEQRDTINRHPREGVEMLRRAGVSDETWLGHVHKHHERADGSGYPTGSKDFALSAPVMILALADRYGAMVSGRAHRRGVPAKDALRSFFLTRGRQFDDTLSLLFVKELSVYPPGLFVGCANGETAVVVQRAKDQALYPELAVYKNRNGELFSRPFRRPSSDTRYAIADILAADVHPRITPRWLWGLV